LYIKQKNKFKMHNSWAQWLKPVILAPQEAEMGKIIVQGQPRQKVWETPSQPIKSWPWWHMPVIPAMKEMSIGGSQSSPAPGIKSDAVSIITKAERAGVIAKVIRVPA
jgi:hypothetical protein